MHTHIKARTATLRHRQVSKLLLNFVTIVSLLAAMNFTAQSAVAETTNPSVQQAEETKLNWYAEGHWQYADIDSASAVGLVALNTDILQSQPAELDPTARKKPVKIDPDLITERTFSKSAEIFARDKHAAANFASDPFYETIFLNQAGYKQTCSVASLQSAC